VTKENYKELLTPLLTAGGGKGFCVNLSVDTSSSTSWSCAANSGCFYIDTVAEPWAGFYFDTSKGPASAPTTCCARRCSRQAPRAIPAASPRSPAAAPIPAWCPGSSSRRCSTSPPTDKVDLTEPSRRSREEWAALAAKVGVKGIHIAERDTQRSKKPKPRNVFVNTWSVEGFVSEGLQPAELGWGTHETWMPANARTHETGCGAAIYLLQPGANTRVRSWCPTPGAQYGFLVTHNESISIADYLTVRDASARRSTGRPATTPITRRTTRCCRCTRCSAPPASGRTRGTSSTRTRSSTASTSSACCSTATATPTGTARSSPSRRRASIAPYQNATGLQVTSAVLAGMVWALENPEAGIVEADDMDFRRCLEVQLPYLGPVIGTYTDWTPLEGRPGFFPEDIDTSDPWQFRNILVRETGDRQGQRWLKVVEGPAHDLRVGLAEFDDATERGRVQHVAVMWPEALEAGRVDGSRLAAPLHEIVGIALQALDGLAPSKARVPSVAVEALDDDAQLVHRTAEPLLILLREFGKLRGHGRGQKADCDCERADEHAASPSRIHDRHTPTPETDERRFKRPVEVHGTGTARAQAPVPPGRKDQVEPTASRTALSVNFAIGPGSFTALITEAFPRTSTTVSIPSGQVGSPHSISLTEIVVSGDSSGRAARTQSLMRAAAAWRSGSGRNNRPSISLAPAPR
jgi:homospermidine synthase